jgi:CheY-like chemotaxis protein
MSAKQNIDVLIVDDDIDIVDSLKDVLTDEGFTVAVAHDGLEALDCLASGLTPNVILLDWMMPRCDGATFRERQRKDVAIARIPVVLLTADTRAETRAQAADAVALLHKPVALGDLLGLIEQFRGPK